MAVHTKALLAQLHIPTYHFHQEDDASELDAILKYTTRAAIFVRSRKPKSNFESRPTGR